MNIAATVTAANAQDLADRINAGFEAGELVMVNGGRLKSRFGQPVARAWQNGTVSVTVEAKAKGKTNDLFIKVGKPLSALA